MLESIAPALPASPPGLMVLGFLHRRGTAEPDDLASAAREEHEEVMETRRQEARSALNASRRNPDRSRPSNNPPDLRFDNPPPSPLPLPPHTANDTISDHTLPGATSKGIDGDAATEIEDPASVMMALPPVGLTPFEPETGILPLFSAPQPTPVVGVLPDTNPHVSSVAAMQTSSSSSTAFSQPMAIPRKFFDRAAAATAAAYVPRNVNRTPVEAYRSETATGRRVVRALEALGSPGGQSQTGTKWRAGHPITSPSASPCYTVRATEPVVDHRPLLFSAPIDDVSIPLIVESIVQHRKDALVVDRALSMLRRLTPRESSRTVIGASYGIEAIVDVMTLHSTRVRIQTQACLVLANLAYKNDVNKNRALHCAAFQAVVAAMSLHRAEQVQAWGCLALRNLSNSSSRSVDDSSVYAGAVDVLVSALENYTESRVVQNQAPVALGHIGSTSAVGLARIREVGGVHAVLVACERNLPNALMVDAGFSALRALITDAENRKLVGLSGGLRIVTEAMTIWRGHMSIVVKGCHVFRYLSFVKVNREMLGRCGAIGAVVCSFHALFL